MDRTKPVLGYILKGYPRISETFISNEILRLEEQGFSIIIFPMRQPRESFSHDSVKQIKAPVHYLPTYLWRDIFKLLPPNLLLALKNPRSYGRAIAVALKRFSRTKKIATFKHLFQAGYLSYKFLGDDTRVNQLHGHFAHSPTSVTMFASILSGIPFSFTAHAKDIYTSNEQQLREKIDAARFVVTCTRYNVAHLTPIAQGSTTPIHCIYHGIDTTLFSSNGAKRTCSPPYSLLTVARITEKKGLPTLYKALAELKVRDVPFSHALIGDGDDKEQVLQLIKDLDLEDCCTLLGTLSHKEVLQHFRSADLFILGCRIAKNGDRDGIPNVLVESLAMGLPALSTSVSAIPEILVDEESGLVVPPEDTRAMTEAIMRLLTDSALRAKVIDTGLQLVRDKFDNNHQTAALGNIFINDFAARNG